MKTVISAVVVLFWFLFCVLSCAYTQKEGTLGNTAVKCTTEHMTTLTKQFGPTIDALLLSQLDPATGKFNVDPIKAATKNFLIEDGMCLLADGFKRILALASPSSPQAGGLTIDRQNAIDTFNQIRVEHGNRTYLFSDGAL